MFDILASSTGVAVVVVLVIAGGLLTCAHNLVTSNVTTSSPDSKPTSHPRPPSITPRLTGLQAKAYANNFIAVHLSRRPTAEPTPTYAAADQPQAGATQTVPDAVQSLLVTESPTHRVRGFRMHGVSPYGCHRALTVGS